MNRELADCDKVRVLDGGGIEDYAGKRRKEAKMHEYISREAANRFVCDWCNTNDRQFCHGCESNPLGDIPTADVVEVRHESWKDIGIMWIDKTNQPDGISTMFCPACERYATRIYYYGDPTDMMNYCPNCGAKMDGGQDDE